MDIGFGLFLGLCFCGLIYLYIHTMDRWNWAKMGKVMFVTLGALILLALSSVGGFLLYEYYQEGHMSTNVKIVVLLAVVAFIAGLFR